jgi:hypothetical protein
MAEVDLRGWAVKGAEQRLLELAAEARAIFAAFPELRDKGRGFEAQQRRDLKSAPLTPAKRRKGMSAAARRAVSLAQKRRWAEWRKRRK